MLKMQPLVFCSPESRGEDKYDHEAPGRMPLDGPGLQTLAREYEGEPGFPALPGYYGKAPVTKPNLSVTFPFPFVVIEAHRLDRCDLLSA